MKLNEKELTEKELEEEKERLAKEKGMSIVEVAKDEFKTRIQG